MNDINNIFKAVYFSISVPHEWGEWNPALITKSNSDTELVKQKERPCLGLDGRVGVNTQCEGGENAAKEVAATYFKYSLDMMWSGKLHCYDSNRMEYLYSSGFSTKIYSFSICFLTTHRREKKLLLLAESCLIMTWSNILFEHWALSFRILIVLTGYFFFVVIQGYYMMSYKSDAISCTIAV